MTGRISAACRPSKAVHAITVNRCLLDPVSASETVADARHARTVRCGDASPWRDFVQNWRFGLTPGCPILLEGSEISRGASEIRTMGRKAADFMTADEYKAALDKLGLGVREAGRVLHLHENTSLRYASGWPIPAAIGPTWLRARPVLAAARNMPRARPAEFQ